MNQAEVIYKLPAIFDTVFLEPVVLAPAVSAKDVPEWNSPARIPLAKAGEKNSAVHFCGTEFPGLILKRQREP